MLKNLPLSLRHAGLILFCLGVIAPGFSQPGNNRQTLLQNSAEFKQKWEANRAEVLRFARSRKIPVREEFPGGRIIEMQMIENGQPIYYTTDNLVAAKSTQTNQLWTGGSLGLSLSGAGYNRIGEWDGGAVRLTHQEFNNTGTVRVQQMDGATSQSDHSTHVAGTLIAGGVNANAKGMAHGATLKAYEWNNDLSEMAAAAANGLEISNHSYGYITGWYGTTTWYGDKTVSTQEDYKFGFYSSYSQSWDQVAYNAPYYLIVKSAGNDRLEGPTNGTYPKDGYPDGYDCIEGVGISKNILTVGAVNDVTNYTGPASVVLASFSSCGPADDGRVKPDIVGNGVGLNSSVKTSNTAYASYSGTSMASPNVAGSLALLQQHYQNTHAGASMRASTLKALVINTANEAGQNPGPDYQFGWGLLNAARAATVITEDAGNLNPIDELILSNGGTYTRTVTVDGTLPLVVTICWTDPAGIPVSKSLDPLTPMLVNDLDLRLLKDGSTFYPWKLNRNSPASAATNNAENDVDNVELVYIANPGPGDYTIQVDHDGILTNPQYFSLVISGIVQSGPVAPVVDFSANTTSIRVGETVSFTDQSTNTPTSWAWTFPGGNPSTSNLQNPAVVYNTPGTFDVTLVATNDAGSGTLTKTAYISVRVPAEPVADFSASPTSINAGQSVSFTDLSTNGPTSWAWTFTGGTPATSTAQNPVVTYSAAGTYGVTLTATNADGSDTESKPGFITVSAAPISYCSAAGINFNYEWIAKVVVGSMTNTSSKSGYSDFTGISVNMIPGGSSSFTLTPGFTKTKYYEYWRIWIDYNSDGDFSDSGELVYSANRKKVAVSGTISVPSTAAGSTRMRIAMKRLSSPASCGTFSYGEVEDYTVNFIAGPIGGGSGNETGLLKQENHLVMYPNPANDVLNVQLSGLADRSEMTIINLIGEKVIQTTLNSSLHQQDISGLKPGIYFLIIRDGEQTVSGRFIKH